MGWNGAILMTNGEIDLVVVPQIGRIMQYSATGAPNALWVNPELVGKVRTPGKDWINYGGDKLWPAPQAIYPWPPDHDADGEPHVAKVVGDTVVLTSPRSRKTGLRFRRTVRMWSIGRSVLLQNEMINESRATLKAGLWQVSQMDDPSVVTMPSFGFKPYEGTTVEPELVKIDKDGVEVKRDPKSSRKYGAAGISGELTARYPGGLFRMRHRLIPGTYPDEGKAQQVYTNPDPLKYVELELTAPVIELKPRAIQRLDVLWTLEPDPQERE